ncbi:MAG: hypothetical protein K2M42_07020 [Oscillospiraceae bacterium]|nr:hypothetical protein [Oscillospiraceae bacterium]
MKKKKILLMLTFIWLFVLCFPSACAAESMDDLQVYSQDTKVEFLINAGIPGDFLNLRSTDDINTLYDLAQTHTLQYAVEQGSYSDFEGGNSFFGTIPESDMILSVHKIETQTPPLPGTRSRIDSILIYVDYAWTYGHPAVCNEDSITVNWDSSLFQFVGGTFSSADYWSVGGEGGIKQTVNSQENPARLNQGGLGYFAMLSNTHALGGPVQCSGSAGFLLEAKSTIYVGSSRRTSINVEYTHNKNPLPGSISLSYNGIGVSVNPGVLQDSVAKPIRIEYSS